MLGAAAVVAWGFLIARFNTPHTWDSGTAFASGVGVMASVFSASCAVIAAVKEAEVRIRRNDPGRIDDPSQ